MKQTGKTAGDTVHSASLMGMSSSALRGAMEEKDNTSGKKG